MIKIERVKESFWKDSYFSFCSEEFYDCSAFRITFFGKTFRIKYSKKFNYFLMAYKTVRAEKDIALQRMMIGKLAQVVLEQMLVKEGVPVSSLEILLADGRSPVFTFKGFWENTPVFIKLNIYPTLPSHAQTTTRSNRSSLRREYEGGKLFSSVCPHCLTPIKYLELPQCEILVTPLIENAKTLHDSMRSASGLKEEYASQLKEVRRHMRENKLAHGDLHGGNLLIGRVAGGEEQLHIIDFTTAKRFTDDSYFSSREYKSDETNFNRYLKTEEK